MTVVDVEHLRTESAAAIAVGDMSFSVADGEILGVLGPNGAGKTTTVECIAGLRRPDSGTLSLLGLHP